MARNFNGTTDLINCGAPSVLDDINTFTYCAWIKPNSIGETYGRILEKASSNKVWYLVATNAMGCLIDRATTDTSAISANSTITMGVWQFVSVTFDATTGAKIYKATLTGALAEVSYAANVVGTGAIITDVSQALTIGNRAAQDRTFDGVIANLVMYSGILTLEEMNSVRYGIMPKRSLIKGWWPLYGNTSPEVDMSGNGSNGTLTGTTQADGPPITPLFGFTNLGWMGNYSVPVSIYTISGPNLNPRNQSIFATLNKGVM